MSINFLKNSSSDSSASSKNFSAWLETSSAKFLIPFLSPKYSDKINIEKGIKVDSLSMDIIATTKETLMTPTNVK